MVSHAVREGLIEATAIPQLECYQAAVLFAQTEGYIPAPETSHAIAQTIREAKQAKEEGKEKVIVMNWSGHGLMDLSGYQAYFRRQALRLQPLGRRAGHVAQEHRGSAKP